MSTKARGAALDFQRSGDSRSASFDVIEALAQRAKGRHLARKFS